MEVVLNHIRSSFEDGPTSGPVEKDQQVAVGEGARLVCHVHCDPDRGGSSNPKTLKLKTSFGDTRSTWICSNQSYRFHVFTSALVWCVDERHL